MVVGARRPQRQRPALAGGAIEALAVRAAARDRPQLSHRCCFTSGISVCTASAMSASVSRRRGRARRRSAPRPGASASISPRVPSMGSTMTTISTSARACPPGSTRRPSCPALRPPAGRASAAPALEARRAAPPRTGDRRRTPCRPASSPTTADSSSIDWRSHAATTSSRMASCTRANGGDQRLGVAQAAHARL